MRRQTLAALRCLAFPRHVSSMLLGGYLRQVTRRRLYNHKSWDLLHFMSDGGYLARDLPWRKRFDAALYHYRRDFKSYDDSYLRKVEERTGLRLWSRHLDGHHYEMRLVAAEDSRREGDLCVQMRVDDACIACMAFVWIDSATFGDAEGDSIFVTRNQTFRGPGLDTFRTSFKQNSPAYFCFAALCAIGQMDGMRQIYGIRHDCQLSYRPEQAEGFRHSYTDFWEKFGGQPSNRYALKITLPLELRSLASLKPAHRSRAERRRAQWADVATQTGLVLEAHRRVRPVGVRNRRTDTSLTGLIAYWLSAAPEWAYVSLNLV